MDSSSASAAGQHFSAVYTNSYMPGFVFIRIFDTGTAMMSVPPGTAYYDGPVLSLVDSSLPMTYQDLTEGAFAQGTASDSSGRYVLDKTVSGGGGAVSVTFTNVDGAVTFAVSNLVVGGVAANASGYLRWTNLLNGANDILPAASSWSFMAPLALGSNLISVVASNASGDSASDLLMIFRAAPAPVLDITNQNATVAHAASNLVIGGTASDLVGQLRWTNQLNGANGALAAASSWSFLTPLAVGTNAITVAGTNASGVAASDLVTLTRAPAVVLDVTTTPVTVRYSVSATTVAGTLSGASGLLRWTNALTGQTGTVAVASSFGISGIALGVGANPITVHGTNLYGDAASDSVTITRGGIGTDLPVLDITNANQSVAGAVSNLIVGGTANLHVAGGMAWSNSLGGSGSFTAATNWSFNAPLAMGTNTITVRGSNLWSEVATDVVVITRIDVPPPVLDVTNGMQTVVYAVSNLVVGGTSSNLSGLIRWTNSLNGMSGTVAAASPWSVNCPLAVGTNPISVLGTNSIGQLAMDSVTLVRSPPTGPGTVSIDWYASFGFFKPDGMTPLLSPAPRATYAILVDAGPNGQIDPVNVCNTTNWWLGGDDVCLTSRVIFCDTDFTQLSYAADYYGLYTGAVSGPVTCYGRIFQDVNPEVGDYFYNGPLAVASLDYPGSTPNPYNLNQNPYQDTLNLVVPACPLLPTVVITNQDGAVRYSVSNLTVGGDSTGLTGSMVWSNNANGATGSGSAAAHFQAGPIPLVIGTNILSVRGTNALGSVASDTVVITRGGLGTDLPVVDITNVNETVGNAVTNRSVAGTANLHVVGSITWSNSLGGSGSLAATANWSFTAPLAVGTNTLTVRGSNLWSEVATDVVVIIRSAGAAPGVITMVVPDRGPAAGSNIVVIAGQNLGDGANVTNVSICGMPAFILSQSITQLVVRAGSGGEGLGDVRVQSPTAGTVVLTNGYTYNLAGVIHGDFAGWFAGVPLPSPRAGLAAAAIGDKIYVMGGFSNSAVVNSAYVFDALNPSNGWTAISNLPVALAYGSAVAAGGKVFVLGGRDAASTSLSSVYRYDPEHPEAGWAMVSNLPAARHYMPSAAINGKIYAIGGRLSATYMSSVYQYDILNPSAGWASLPSLPAARGESAAAVAAGRIFVMGGFDGNASFNTALAFNPSQPSSGWTSISNLPGIRDGTPGAASLHGKVFLMGGWDAVSISNASCYNPARPAEGWTVLPPLPEARSGTAGAAIRGTLYSIGGGSTTQQSAVYKGRFNSGLSTQLMELAGGQSVVIAGSYLGDGTDITNVTLAGIPASIVSQSMTQVVVTAGAAGYATNGPVRLHSTSYGETISEASFAYQNGEPPAVPYLDITNMNQAVAHSVSNRTIGGVASNLVGQIRWTNQLNGAAGTLAAASSWSFLAPLAVGTNAITVAGTNASGVAASDLVTLTRAPAVVLDVTTTPVTVRYSVSATTVAGTLSGASGLLRWTNALTGQTGTVAVASSFGISGIALGVGANPITVHGTNLYGDAASDSVTITRGDLGTDLPVLDITNVNETVGNAVTNRSVAGTANLHVVGSITWSNSLGGSGSLAAATNWSFNAPLAVGANTITVRGSNLWSEVATDVVVITRSVAATPFIDITNTAARVDHAVSNLTVGGISSNLSGQIRWTNLLNGASGSLAAAGLWSFFTPLAVGSNTLVVTGTNGAGQSASDSITIFRSNLVVGGTVTINWIGFVGFVREDGLTPLLFGAPKATYVQLLDAGPNGLIDQVDPCNPNGWVSGDDQVLDTTLITNPDDMDFMLQYAMGDYGTYSGPATGPVLCFGRIFKDPEPGPGDFYYNSLPQWIALDDPFNPTPSVYDLNTGDFDPAVVDLPVPPCGGGVSVDITNTPTTVGYATSNLTIGGVASNATGFIRWTNSLNGIQGTVAAASTWAFTTPLGVGTNLLTVVATNGLGASASDVLQIIRQPAPAPVLDITNVNQVVASAVSNLVVGGTSSNLSGHIVWTNLLNGTSGSLAADPAWSFVAAIGLGTNPIVVRGSNLVGQVAADTVVVTRTAAALPLVDITNANETVGFAVTLRGLGGLASNVVGVLTWTNQAGQVGGTIPAAALWSIPGVSLAVGANSIVVQGSNGAGNVASDTVTLTRVAAPILDITNINAGVRYSTTNWNIGGVSTGLVGQLRWTNALTGGSGTVAAGNPFAVSGIVLAVGSNWITVAGTNLYGDAASDSMYINRGGLGTDLPVLDITNVNAAVGHAVSSLAVGGTANLHVVGNITWSNSLGGAGGFAAAPNWSFNAPLAVGTNVITVRGTNQLAESMTDTVTLIRLPPPPMVTFYDLEADFRADANVDGQPWTYRYQAGSLARDGNYELLPSFTNDYLGGIEGLSGWHRGEIIPLAGCNLTGQPLTNGAFRIEPGHSDVHPSSTELVVVSWLAPTTDVVRLEYLFADYDAGGGDGVRWYVAYESTDIDSGILANGATTTVRTLGPFAVNAGDRLHFIVDPGPGGGGFDSTRIMARIRIGANPSRLDITTPDLTVINSTASLLVEGTSSNLTGQITWTNTLGGSGALAASSAWSFNAALAVGTNLITVRGSNLWQESLTDTLTVIREAPVGPGQGGNVWTNLGAGISGLAGRCWDIGFTTNQQILVAGDFNSPAQHVALWNGSAWISVGHLGDVGDCVVRDPQGRMVVGGSFVTAGGVSANRIARWNGSSWTNLGAGLNGAPQDLVLMPDQSLVAAGQFTTAGGQPASNVARWTGSAWTNLGAGCDGVVRTLAQDGAGNLYAGGDFTNAGGIAARYVARWNGTTWTNLGSGLNGSVNVLRCDGAGNLYAGGTFTNAGGVAARYVARWNGAAWTNLGSGLSSWVQGMAVDGAGNLYVGGHFTNAGGVAANRVAKWNGTSWTNMGAGMNDDVFVLEIDAQGYLHAGGQYTTADGLTARAIARWNNPLSMNPPPYWTSTPVTLATVGKRYTYRLSAVDPQQEPLTFQGVNLPGWLSLVTGSGQVLGSNVITTVAGDGNYGFTGDGGQATAARLAWPHSVIVDGAGRLYLSDCENQRIRRVDTNGIITTVAGNGSAAYNGDGIAATNASLYYPIGLALDATGRLYIADSYHYRVRRVELDGTITTVAGTGVSGFSGDGGPATNAQLSSTGDVALDAAGNLYIADSLNSRIRVVNPAGIIRTIAGTGSWGFGGDGQPATNAILNRPMGVSVDRNGLIYIADHYNHRVRRIALDGTITTVAGTGSGGYNGDGMAATAALLKYPYDVTVDDAGNLYIADDENNRVRKVGTNGVISTLAGRGVYAFGGDGGAATNARVAYPTDVELDAAGNLYICDAGNQRIRKIAGEAGGLRLTGIPGPGDVGSITITLQVSDGINVVPQVFTLGVGQLLAPTNLQAVAVGLSRVDLTWTDNNAGETGYVLERRTSTASVWAVIANLPANSSNFADTGLGSGQTYSYRILAVNQDGPSQPSSVATATTLAVPNAPSGLSVASVTTNRVALTWLDNASNEEGYEIQRRIGALGAWLSIGSTGAGGASWTDLGVQPNTFYAYRVRATNAAGASAFSAEVSATTPPTVDDPDCGHGLLVTATNLLWDGAAQASPVTVPEATVVGGTLTCQQTSPRGAGAIHRVAVGFRNLDGFTMSPPREISLLYGTPGCPGRTVAGVPLPSDLRVPTNAGVYQLWIEAFVSPLDPRGLFSSQVRTAQTALARSLATVTVQPRPVGQIEVRALAADALLGQRVTIPVLVSSTGGESIISFSVDYPVGRLSAPWATSGADAPALWVVLNTGTPGRVGCLLMMPGDEALGAGTKRVVDLSFNALATGVSSLVFADSPVARDVALVDPGVTPSVTWVGSTVQVRPAGFEGDLAPRPGGDMAVTEADRLLLQLMVSGLEAPANSNEFQKADCAPRGTSGDGRINASDLRQIYRYLQGLDPLQPAAGPGSPVVPPPSLPTLRSMAGRTLTLADVTTNRGDVVRLPVWLDAQGDESVLTFSLGYDAQLLTFLDMQLVGPATNAIAAPALQNSNQGEVGLALALPNSQVMPAGPQLVAEVYFASAAGAQSVTTTVGFADAPMPSGVAGIDAGALVADFSDQATVVLLAEVAPGAPAVPSSLVAEGVATNQVNLDWIDASANESGFRVLRRTGTEAWTEIATLSADQESYADIGLPSDTEFRYLVAAFNGSGTNLSAEVLARTWSGMDAWRQARFGSPDDAGPAADEADWDADGLPNYLEYALGLDPRFDHFPLTPFVIRTRDGVQIGTNQFLTAEFDVWPGAGPAAVIHMQVDTNVMGVWATDMVPVDSVMTNGAARYRVRSDQPLGARPREFMRMQVTPPSP